MVRQHKPIRGIVGKRAEKERYVNLDGDGCISMDVRRDVEGVGKVGSTIETAGVMGEE